MQCGQRVTDGGAGVGYTVSERVDEVGIVLGPTEDAVSDAVEKLERAARGLVDGLSTDHPVTALRAAPAELFQEAGLPTAGFRLDEDEAAVPTAGTLCLLSEDGQVVGTSDEDGFGERGPAVGGADRDSRVRVAGCATVAKLVDVAEHRGGGLIPVVGLLAAAVRRSG